MLVVTVPDRRSCAGAGLTLPLSAITKAVARVVERCIAIVASDDNIFDPKDRSDRRPGSGTRQPFPRLTGHMFNSEQRPPGPRAYAWRHETSHRDGALSPATDSQ